MRRGRCILAEKAAGVIARRHGPDHGTSVLPRKGSWCLNLGTLPDLFNHTNMLPGQFLQSYAHEYGGSTAPVFGRFSFQR